MTTTFLYLIISAKVTRAGLVRTQDLFGVLQYVGFSFDCDILIS